MKKETIITVDYEELEGIVTREYNLPAGRYSFVATEQCGNDSSHRFDVSAVETLDSYEQRTIDEITQDKTVPNYSNGTILQDLVNKGILEPGVYLVEVSW